jgi:hypothetical protein
LRQSRTGEKDSNGKDRESQYHAGQVYSPAAQRQAVKAFKDFGKMRPKWAAAASTLAGLEAAMRLVDDVDAALAAHDAVVAVAAAQRFQRITDFHGIIP